MPTGASSTDTSSQRSVLVVQPDSSCALDRFGPWLAEQGLDVRVVSPCVGDPVPGELHEDGLIVLGGDMSAMDDSNYPWLEDIRRLYREAVSRGRPALGICLGGQLLAQALGGTVTRGDRGLEVGVVHVSLRSEAADDALFGRLPQRFPVGAFHRDMIASLPPDAVWLGESEMYPHQIFRVGTAWGVQFHPELSPTGYGSWLPLLGEDDAESVERALQGARDFAERDLEVASATATLARSFAHLARVSSPSRRE